MENKKCKYPYLRQAVKEIPEMKTYLRILKHYSGAVQQDLKNIEQILSTHEATQVYDFMPRYLKLILEIDNKR